MATYIFSLGWWDISLALNMTVLRFVGIYTCDDVETVRAILSISSAIFCTGFSIAHLPQAMRNVPEYLSVFFIALKNDCAVKFSSYSTFIALLLR